MNSFLLASPSGGPPTTVGPSEYEEKFQILNWLLRICNDCLCCCQTGSARPCSRELNEPCVDKRTWDEDGRAGSVAEHKPMRHRQIGPAAAWRKHLRRHGILKVKFHEDCLERNMRTLSRASKGCAWSTPPRLLTAEPAYLPLEYDSSRLRHGSVRFQVDCRSGVTADK
jgi:hypothetical protein